MTHQYENAAKWFQLMCKTNNWSHGLYTYIAGICYAELSRQNPNITDYASKSAVLLDRVPHLLQKRKSFGGKRIPFEQFVDRKVTRFQTRGAESVFEGVTGPVTEEIIYLLCNGQKRMNTHELERSWKSCELWSSVPGDVPEDLSMALIKSVIDRNAGRLEIAKERIENEIISAGLSRRVPLGTNDWIAGFAYYEVLCEMCTLLIVDGGNLLVAEKTCGGSERMVKKGE